MADSHAETVRHRLAVRLTPPASTAAPDPDVRTPVEADVPALGRLMWDAYRGAPDERDAGTGVASATEEIRKVFDGVYGTYLPEASFVAGEGGRLVAAALGHRLERRTAARLRLHRPRASRPRHGAPADRGRGRRAGAARVRPPEPGGDANVRARGLYESMGFAEVPEERAAGG